MKVIFPLLALFNVHAEDSDWNQRGVLIISLLQNTTSICYHYCRMCFNLHWMTEGKCPLWPSWNVRLTSTPGSVWRLCQTATRRPWKTWLCARSAAGAWPGSPATLCHLNWGPWTWTSLTTAGTTTISGSRRTWSAPAPCWVEKTPVRFVQWHLWQRRGHLVVMFLNHD